MDKSAFAKLLAPHIPANVIQADGGKPSELAESFLKEVAGGVLGDLAPSSSFESFSSGGAFSSSFARGG